ncbi:MAG TPA: TetR/AcrR family transcriptional regulator [Acidimicrobiales bacterium]|nr:TetR/AcrR family transcriptional regulator [Acidimicrobiales bacterium]
MPDRRRQLLEAAYDCIGRYGMAKTTVEDVARAAGVSRATIYRHFPGGRDQLVAEVVSWQAAVFFEQLATAVAGAPDLHAVLVETLLFARRAVLDHAVLQKVLETEPERLLPQLTFEGARILGFVKGFLRPHLSPAGLRPGIGPDEAADLLGRLLLSYIGSPGSWDLADRDQVEALVQAEMLAAVT